MDYLDLSYYEEGWLTYHTEAAVWDMETGKRLSTEELFREETDIAEILGENIQVNVADVVLKHLEYAIEYYGEKTAVPMFRKHASWYSAGMPNSSEFRIMVNQIADAGVLKVAIREFWGMI